MHRSLLTIALVSLAIPGSASADISFEKELLPVLEAKCLNCHKADYEKNGKTIKAKAGLRLDAAWAIQKGSNDGPVLVPGKSAESGLFERVTLPPDDEDFMPPKGKADPLTPEETAILKKWIDEGAKFGEWTGNLEGKPKESPKADQKETVSQIQAAYERLAKGLNSPDEKLWESLATSGARVQRLSNTSPLLSLDFRIAHPPATDEAVLAAKILGPYLVHLDLGRSEISDAALALVNDTPKLIRLDLSETKVGDQALSHLKNLKELRYLNLYGTEVTDAGLKNLEGLSSLESVYLWGSKVTKAGVNKLAAALPNAKINFK